MRHAAVLIVTILTTTALRCIKLLVDCTNDIGHRNLGNRTGDTIATTRTAHAVDQLVAAQLAKQLLKIRERNLLALANAGQSHRAIVTTQRQIDHGRYSKSPFGGKSHDISCL
jgi:hypothetical protein